MPLFGAAELAALQATAATTMADTCVVQRRSVTNDGFGSQSETWTTVATTTARLGVPSGSFMADLAAKQTDLASWQVDLPYGTDVRVADRLVLDSQTLTVQAVFSPETLTLVVRVLASELR